MLFQSLEFLIFFSIFFFIYWFVSKHINIRNILLLGTSFALYSIWDYRFSFLLLFIILINYFSAQLLNRENKLKNLIFYLTLIFNLLPLLIFKYYNFFTESINDIFTVAGVSFNLQTLKLILPVGISFLHILIVKLYN